MNREQCASLSSFPDSAFPRSTFHYEEALYQQGFSCVAGVDEAGRGPLAGPVVAGCVVLSPACEYQRFKDSKKCSEKLRLDLYAYLQTGVADIGVAIVSAREIEQLNILQASLLAMKRAVLDCANNTGSIHPDYLLIDGNQNVPMQLPQQTLVKGESKSASIAAASIIAKVTRDRLMKEYHDQYPYYNFQQNKGYPTLDHRKAIARYGPCELHRRTFKGVREFIDNDCNPSPVQSCLY